MSSFENESYISLIPLENLFKYLKIMSEMMVSLFPENEISNIAIQLNYFYNKFLLSKNFKDSKIKFICFSNAINFILSTKKCFEFIENSRQKYFTKVQVSIYLHFGKILRGKHESNLLDKVCDCYSILLPRLFLPNILDLKGATACHDIAVKIYNSRGMYSSSKKQTVFLINNYAKLKNKSMLKKQIQCYTNINIKLASRSLDNLKDQSTLIENNDFKVENCYESDFFSFNQVLRCELQSCLSR